MSPHGGRDRPRRPRARSSPGPWPRVAPHRRLPAAARPSCAAGWRTGRGPGFGWARRPRAGASLAGKGDSGGGRRCARRRRRRRGDKRRPEAGCGSPGPSWAAGRGRRREAPGGTVAGGAAATGRADADGGGAAVGPVRQPRRPVAAPVEQAGGTAAEALLERRRRQGLRRPRAHRRERSAEQPAAPWGCLGGAERTPGSLGGTVGSVSIDRRRPCSEQATGSRRTVDQTLQGRHGRQRPKVPNVTASRRERGTPPARGGGTSEHDPAQRGGPGASMPACQVQTPGVTCCPRPDAHIGPRALAQYGARAGR